MNIHNEFSDWFSNVLDTILLAWYFEFLTLKFKNNCLIVGNRKILIYKVFIFAENHVKLRIGFIVNMDYIW